MPFLVWVYNINHMICKDAEALPLVWSAQSHKSWQSRRDFFPLSWVVLSWGRLFFWPFLLVRVARTAVARCAGGPVSCWHYRFIEDTFHSAPDHGLDGRPSVLEGKTIWCLASTDTDTTNRHNTWTAERSKTNTWTEHLFIFLSLGSKVTRNHRISGFSSICKWSHQILLYNGGFAPPPPSPV